MKLDTIKKYTSFIEEMTKGDYISLKDFADQNELNYDTLNVQLSAMRKEVGEYKDLCVSAMDQYEKVQRKWKSKVSEPIIPGLEEDTIKEDAPVEEDIQDTDSKIESSILRNRGGKIVGYSFKVYRRDKTPVQGVLNRDEMQLIYRLYSYYGASITQREISRHFPDYSLQDFKRILRAFNITKASGPFAPHMYEEKSEEELKEYHLREKENDFLKKIEKDELNDIKKTTVKLARENQELKQQLDNIANNIKVDISGLNDSLYLPTTTPSETSIVVHLSDLHIGAKCESNTLYPNKWDKEELKRRLEVLANKLYELGHFDTLILNLLGDNLDGMDNQTARRDHFMPQNMDNMEQVNVFIEVMIEFILKIRQFANKVKIYSVKEGNHDGIVGYVASLALINVIQNICPDIDCLLFKDFIGKYEFKNHTYLICHGK